MSSPENRSGATHGDLRHLDVRTADGTWCSQEHYIKELVDLGIMREVVEATRFVPHYERVERFLREMGGQGWGTW